MKYCLILVLAASILYPQQSAPGNARPKSRSTGRALTNGSSPDDVLPDFKGTIAIATAKKITLTPEDVKPGEDANTMDFEISRKTMIFQREKKLKPADLKAGDSVSIESKRLLDGTLEAVTIRKM